ncbi:MAG TPA: ATP-binding protein [Candidatus Acidoferrum sp.]|jgi:two-component system phosphate regulon sensor histidine kinase PhoR|nr:ATP-binding protein [Candidatus Acidoferrum sp.]
MQTNIFAIAWRSRTYLRILYLLLAFPLGLFYFVFLVTLIATGVATALIAGIGIGLLLLALACWFGFAGLERILAIHWLGVRVPPRSVPRAPAGSYRERLRLHIVDPVTWKSLAYLLLEFPFGVFSFSLVTFLFSLCTSFLLYPVAYLVSNYIYNRFGGKAGGMNGEIFPGIPITGHNDPNVFAFLCLFTLAGVPLLFGSLHLLNGLGLAWGRFAQVMLGVDESQARLTAAETRAASERARADSADKSRRELVVNASHELRTPVASLRGHLDSLSSPDRKPRLDPQAREYVAIMASEVRRLSALVDDLLSLARADAQELRLELRPLRAEEVARQVCETLAPLARRERELQLVQTSEAGLPFVLGDRDRLAQVLTNLVRNAINYTPDGGIISVTTARAGDDVALTVSDTGIGMPPEDLERVFERFYRTDESRSRESGGSGLGLAIVRDLLSAMGASISVESRQGVGSSFRILLHVQPAQ